MRMKIDFTKQSVGSLVARRPNGQFISPDSLFVTISPNPNVNLKCFRGSKSFSMKYGLLPHQLQYQYCLKILNSCYLPFLSDQAELVGTWEFNKTNNLHFHLIINDPALKSDQRFKCYQRDISCCSLVAENRSKKSNKDYMNNIVRVTKDQDDILDYLDKDHETDPLFPNYYMFSEDENVSLLNRSNVEIMSFDKFKSKYFQPDISII